MIGDDRRTFRQPLETGVSFLLSMESPDWVRLLWGLGGTFGGYLLVMIAVEYWFAAGYFTEVRRALGMGWSRIG